MIRPIKFVAALCGLVLLAAAVSVGVRINAGEPTRVIRVIYTANTMGYLEPCG